jgi:hypothetical protein
MNVLVLRLALLLVPIGCTKYDQAAPQYGSNSDSKKAAGVPDKASPTKEGKEPNEAPPPTLPGASVPTAETKPMPSAPASPSDLNMNLIGLPTAATDASTLTLKVTSSQSTSKYAYQINGDCSSVAKLTQAPFAQPITLNLLPLPLGPNKICLIGFDDANKTWVMAPLKAFVLTKKAFERNISAVMELPAFGCKSKPMSQTTVVFGSKNLFSWGVDPASDGCTGASAKGNGEFFKLETTGNTTSGYWRKDGIEAGWVDFTWLDAGRTKFKGAYGYGPRGGKVAGSWNSK